ncbi:hypothetical protein M885DRAFT_527067 [Pelagophyceae sp. CCMP2097]|nr:hypothetical protein M885DRAFT_527067 [Pelagophyceae sp. CCMP2097]
MNEKRVAAKKPLPPLYVAGPHPASRKTRRGVPCPAASSNESLRDKIRSSSRTRPHATTYNQSQRL